MTKLKAMEGSLRNTSVKGFTEIKTGGKRNARTTLCCMKETGLNNLFCDSEMKNAWKNNEYEQDKKEL